MAMNPLLVAVVISFVILLIVTYSRYKFNQDLKDSYKEGDDLMREYEAIMREHKSMLENEEEDES